MHPFVYSRATAVREAIQAAAHSPTAQTGATIRFVAGGTTLLDLMKLNVETPGSVIDINSLPLNDLNVSDDGAYIGALVRNSDLAFHPPIKEHYPVLSEAILHGASAQLRNMATTGGNLLQRTRCLYFRNTLMPCNKREPGSGCGAMEGENRTLALFGVSDKCIATHPSDMCVALVALEAEVHVSGASVDRVIKIENFFVLPGDTPQIDNVLEPGDLITAITLPPPRRRSQQAYLKLRDRASYEYALVSTAAVVEQQDGKITYARLVLGGVGPKPWRVRDAELALEGKPVEEASFALAAEVAFRDAHPQSENAFKIELGKRCITHALRTATKLA